MPYKYSNHHSTATVGRSCSRVLMPTWARRENPDFLRSLMRTGPNLSTLCYFPVPVKRTKLWCFLLAFLLCFFKAVGPFSGCCSDDFAQCPQSLLYCIAFISLLSWSGNCLGQPIECSLFDHWWFNQLLSLPSAIDGYFSILLLATNLQAELFSSSCYFQVTEVTKLQANVVYIHSPLMFEVSFRESIPN